MRTVKFFTLGCKVNQYETQEMREGFLRAGFKESENSHPASLYVINTCTVTHRADSESLNLIRRARRENNKAKIIVTGCLTELDRDKISSLDKRAKIVRNLGKSRKKGITYFKGHTRAFLKIQDGCDNFCSYCKVPLVRGRPRSKPLENIIKESEALVKNGTKEIVLCGICLGSYGKDLSNKVTLIDVLRGIEKIKGLLRIRLSSIEPDYVTDNLIEEIAKAKKVCRHLHIPLQSGDDIILKKMNRNINSSDYLALIKRLQKSIPGIAISTDVLVGFPGEKEVNFQNTVKLIQKVKPVKVHVFPYSKREDTAAALNLCDDVADKTKKNRLRFINHIVAGLSYDYKKQLLGEVLDVLIESRYPNHRNSWQGYSESYIKVQVESSKNLSNMLIPIRINKINKMSHVLGSFV